jgi:hypothetical protein
VSRPFSRERRCSCQNGRDFLPIWSCSVWGLPCPRHYCRGGALLPHLFTLTPPILERARCVSTLFPEWAGRYVFCGTFRPPSLNSASRTLSGTLLCGVRTFLPAHSAPPVFRARRYLSRSSRNRPGRMGGAAVRSGCLRMNYSERPQTPVVRPRPSDLRLQTQSPRLLAI